MTTDDVQYDADRAQWLGWARDDAVRALVGRGHQIDDAKALLAGIPDELFQLIRSQAVNELAECYIIGMRSTVKITEVMKYSQGMAPADTELSIATRVARNKALAAMSARLP